MRNAPSVNFPVGRCAIRALLLGCFGILLAGALALGWNGLARWQALCLATAVLAWWGAALWTLWRQPCGWLCFGGGASSPLPGDTDWAWRDQPGSEALPLAAPRIVLDLQQWLLLQFRGAAGAPTWIWLEARSAPGDWLALRRALMVNAAR